jgi:hypothetical protein
MLSAIHITVKDDPEKDKAFKEELKNNDDSFKASSEKLTNDQEGVKEVKEESKPQVE